MTDLITAEETIRVIEGEGRGCGPEMAVRLARVIFNLHAELATLKAQKWVVQHTDTINDIVSLGMERDRLAAELAQAKADAQAAVALVVERAVQCAWCSALNVPDATSTHGLSMFRAGAEAARESITSTIRALAPDAGVKALAELRAERDRAVANQEIAWSERDNWRGIASDNGRAAMDNLAAIVALEADRDRLTAELAVAVAAAEQQDALRAVTLATMQSVSAANAALEEKVRGLVEAGKSLTDRLENERGDYINMSDVMSAISAYDAALAATQPAEGEQG